MCGRFVLDKIDQLEKRYGAKLPEKVSDNYNIAPGQQVLTVVKNSPVKFQEMKWGIIPSWSKEKKVTFSNINARIENILQSRVYASLFKNKRCLIPASGYYEWQRKNNTKIPYYFSGKDAEIISLAGLYDIWEKDGEKIYSCSIITTNANSKINTIHSRMPAIIDRAGEQKWLNSDSNIDQLTKLIKSSKKDLNFYPVSQRVNNPKNNYPKLISPITND